MIKKYLTSNYDKHPNSNISKFCKMISDELQELKDLYNEISLINNIDYASGNTLDMIGENINQYRGDIHDELYRVLIKSKIARNRADGTLNTILDVLELSLGMDKSELKLKEGTNENYYSIQIESLPLDILNEIAMSVNQLGRLIETMIAAGVILESVIFEGTFEYGGLPLENNLESGFDYGELGDVYDPEGGRDLPI